MGLDDASADGLEVQHAGVAREMPAAPGAAPILYRGRRGGADFPMVERSHPAGDAARMAPPNRRAIDQGDVAADMLALEQGRPKMPGAIRLGIVFRRVKGAAAHAHALEVVDRLGKYWKGGRSDPMRGGLELLT